MASPHEFDQFINLTEHKSFFFVYIVYFLSLHSYVEFFNGYKSKWGNTGPKCEWGHQHVLFPFWWYRALRLAGRDSGTRLLPPVLVCLVKGLLSDGFQLQLAFKWCKMRFKVWCLLQTLLQISFSSQRFSASKFHSFSSCHVKLPFHFFHSSNFFSSAFYQWYHLRFTLK